MLSFIGRILNYQFNIHGYQVKLFIEWINTNHAFCKNGIEADRSLRSKIIYHYLFEHFEKTTI